MDLMVVSGQLDDYVCACDVPMQTDKSRLCVLCCESIYHLVNPWLLQEVWPMIPPIQHYLPPGVCIHVLFVFCTHISIKLF